MKIIILNARNAQWAEISEYMDRVSPQRRERISCNKSERKKTLLLLSEMLVRKELAKYSELSEKDIIFGYGPHGKPYAKNAGELHFSVSHSEGCIVFVLNDMPVGVDAQRISDMRPRTAERFFTRNENALICGSERPERDFFRIWTSKEAYVKMLGVGLSKPLASFDVLSEELKGYFRSVERSGTMITVCCENASQLDIDMEETEFGQLLL